MDYQSNQINDELEVKPLSVRERWSNLHPYLRRGIIAGIILVALSVISTIVLTIVVLSWKPNCMVIQKTNYPISGSNQYVQVQTANIQEKKIYGPNINSNVRMTTIRVKPSRLLQEGGSASPSILTYDNGLGVVAQAVTETDITYFVDPDQVLASYQATDSRLLQQEGGTIANPSVNELSFDNPAQLQQQLEASILKSAADQLELNPDDLTITYEQTLKATLNSDNSYTFQQLQDNANRLLFFGGGFRANFNKQTTITNTYNYYTINYNNSFNKYTNVAFDGGKKNKNNVNFLLKSYLPEVEKATETEFSENSEIQVAVDTTPTSRLLQSLGNSTNSSAQNEECIKRRNKPIKYRTHKENRKVKITNETSFNCSFQCTGDKKSRTCPVDLFKKNKCGYRTRPLTGNEKVRRRFVVKYDPEAAKAKREKRKEEWRKRQNQSTNSTTNANTTNIVTDPAVPISNSTSTASIANPNS